MNKQYSKINKGKGWVDYPIDDTAVNAYHLNHMEDGIVRNDDRIVDLDRDKASRLELSEVSGQMSELFKDVSYDNETGILTFVKKSGETIPLDLPLEMIALDIYYDPVSEKLILPLVGGGKFEVDISSLITQYEFLDSETIHFSVSTNEDIAFNAKWNDSDISYALVADPLWMKIYQSIILESELEISQISATYAKPNSDYYVNADICRGISGDDKIFTIKFPGGAWKWNISMQTQEDIGDGTKKVIGYYTKPGCVTASIKEGSIQEKHLRPDYLSDIRVESAKAQSSVDSAEQKALESANSALLSKSYSGGNTGIREGEDTDNAKYYSEQAKQALDSLEQAGTVTGVKGNAEAVYRTGNVEISPDDIGAPSNAYMAEHFVSDYVKTVTAIFNTKGWYRIAGAFSRCETSCTITLKRFYNNGQPEYQKVQLIAGYAQYKFVPIVSYTEVRGAKHFAKMRLVRDAEANKDYIEVYYDTQSGNNIRATIEDAIGVTERDNWEIVDPVIVPETQSGVTVVTSIDLPENLDAGDYLKSGGRIPTAGKTGYIAYPSDAYYQVARSNVSGYIRITLPVSWTNTFIKFTVSIFTLGGNESCDYHISGYNYAVTPAWSNCTAICTGKPGAIHTNLSVRFGYDGSKCVICIGETNTVWNYLVVQVHDVIVGYYKNDYETWKSGWNIGVGTGLPGTINATMTNTNVAYGGVANSCNGNSATATKATQDGNGNNIANTYARKDETASWDTITSGSFNDVVIPGVYTMHNISGNAPITSDTSQYYGLIVLTSTANNTNYVEQIAVREATTEVYVRYKGGSSSNWGAWSRLVTETELSSYQKRTPNTQTSAAGGSITFNTNYYNNCTEIHVSLILPKIDSSSRAVYSWVTEKSALQAYGSLRLIDGYKTGNYEGLGVVEITTTSATIVNAVLMNTEYKSGSILRIDFR